MEWHGQWSKMAWSAAVTQESEGRNMGQPLVCWGTVGDFEIPYLKGVISRQRTLGQYHTIFSPDMVFYGFPSASRSFSPSLVHFASQLLLCSRRPKPSELAWRSSERNCRTEPRCDAGSARLGFHVMPGVGAAGPCLMV